MVIVVTTKNPRPEKMTVNISTKAGVSQLNNGNLKMMNGAELYDYYASYANADEISFPRWTPELRNSNFDWWKLAWGMQPAHYGLQMVQTARLPYYPRCFVARRFSALSLALARQCLWLRHASGCCWFGWLRQSKQTAIIYHHQNSQPQALLIQQVSSSITSME